MPVDIFHPAVARWFAASFEAPTEAQAVAWPAIASARDVLIAAPTGSGKTLAAFLSAIDQLVRQAAAGELADATQVVYVSPLKALSNDIRRNLEQPLSGIAAELAAQGFESCAIRTQVRTGDTPQSERVAMRKMPPHVLVTTPESLYLLLTSDSGRAMLSSTRSVIVDEIHALAASKRGAHLALSLERLEHLCGRRLQRIGLSATQKPIEEVARFLVGESRAEQCVIVDRGHIRGRDLALLLPDSPLEAVMSNEVWENIYDHLAEQIRSHRTTLIFANTRRMVERVTRHLSERIGEEWIAAHHGSLAKELRLDAEQRLKSGKLRALVATASLELGIDIGDVELVCQLSTPRSICAFLQRVGRANHAVGGVPKGRLVPLSRDDLVECTALIDAVRRGELDALQIPAKPLDVLAQQLVAEVSTREYGEQELFELVRRAWPYHALEQREFDELLRMLAEGIATRRGRQSAHLHRDAVNRRVRARRGARLTAITCGGAIPDNADYQVVLEPAGTFIGTLNEDFAVESLAGDVFQLGNCSYRILRVEAGRVRVEDAKGQPPTMPFWLGEAPARSAELSMAVSRLRTQIEAALPDIDAEHIAACIADVATRYQLPTSAARQLVEYLAGAKAMLGVLPTQQRLVFERFFDEAGDMHLVVHSPFGARINRAFGLLLRKRFCRAFNFELQAAATEDAIVLSLGETHSFALEQLPRFLNSRSAEPVLIQALLDAPLFATRWRWVVTISLAVRRSRAGKKTPAPLLRMAAEDLISVVFPEQLACAENLGGEREIPDHPLVRQVLRDCLHEAMDIDGLVALLERMERAELEVITRELPQPSLLAQEILTARPYAYLDDAPLEERRTQAVAARRWLDPETAAEFAHLDPAAIAAVRAEAWPAPEGADELHDALMLLGAMTRGEANELARAGDFDALLQQRRATRLRAGAAAQQVFWVAAEQLPLLASAYPLHTLEPVIEAPAEFRARSWEPELAQRELLRGRLQATGPTTIAALVAAMALPRARIEAALVALESEGFVLRGRFTPAAEEEEWCERRLLARIHRYTIRSLRAEIEPVASADFMRFLLDWQGLTRAPRPEGVGGLATVVEQLEGFEVPAVAWESDVLPARLHDYDGSWLDSLCLSGRALWARLDRPASATAGPVRATPIALLTRKNWPLWQRLRQLDETEAPLSASAQAMAEYLRRHGASFFDEIVQGADLLRAQAESGLAELVAAGRVSADSFGGLRALLMPLERKRKLAARGRRAALFGLEEAGRWSLVHRSAASADAAGAAEQAELIEAVAWVLLRRYGVVFRRMLTREAPWLPPWHALLRAFRRLEAQGHIRGGRFVAGVSGEQYALPDAVGVLRAARKREADGTLVSLSAADPLNLAGILTPGARVAALAGNRVLLKDGVPIASYAGGEVQFLASLAPPEQWRIRNALLRNPVRPKLSAVGSQPAP
ncbi:MAG TPA: DEAD/DEAH box helicase [Steroidobacteraceae bacterium]|jgi:ATP-dependent Lhr-like helicase|nr:DEAD/DEAH box helicase [Steroidobacteraceae bacterium]